ncbi:hypothetical protein HMPREF1624_07684 [Sporothrix schenckii ATCC 58251]|uniref:Heterokaryon incompatibility domain-containing protein n=1 Tax=Sporothrix schenckii (strain ATCC 58251 / de Perez 2211183) TaxID=1391915 RepID=U7PKG6_SPOS1|nr:hypothetical protein HMPREF1624_07684 [Sporothrix schenckii ATCC 58251]
MLCSLCQGMSLQRLVDLAKRDFRSGFFPSSDYYHHHASFAELEACATGTNHNGCYLCLLIVDCFASAQHDASNPLWPVPPKPGTATPAGVSAPHTAGATMRDVARKLTHSDVRIALCARHAATGATIQRVQMFDMLAVRLGDRLELGDPLRVPDLFLVLRILSFIQSATEYKTLQNSLPVVDGYRIGCSTPDRHLGSAGNFKLARSWLDDCSQHHKHCSTTAHTKLPPQLPTRVIDVTCSPARIVQAVDINKGRPDHGCAEYVALSHCWGRPPIKTLLKSTTIKEYTIGIPEQDLPRNFRDAITVTRNLGVPYVWIDSLCIIQDSVDDWRYESVRMGALYSRATFSLLAMAADQSEKGLLNDVPWSIVPACTVPFVTDAGTATLQVSPIYQDSENLRQLSDTAPLSVRGWTLQEVVFSARILFYGAHQIYWFCTEGGYKSAESLPDGILYPHNKYPSIASAYFGEDTTATPTPAPLSIASAPTVAASTTEAILTDFYHFVESYARRTLTFGTDKFPAVASFAQNVDRAIKRSQSQRRGGSKPVDYSYVAGIWSGDFRRGLLFCPDGMHAPHVLQTNEKDGLYRAPSWSWAVTDAPIVFLAAQTPLTGTPSPLNAQLLSWSARPRDPNNAFGAIDGARIVVKGRVCRLRRSATHFIGAYTWDKDEEQGSAWFDDQPNMGAGPDLLSTANGNCIVFDGKTEEDTDGEDTFLCTYYAPGTTTGAGSNKQTVAPNVKDYERQEYTLLMVDLGQADDEKQVVKNKVDSIDGGSNDSSDDDGSNDDFDDDGDFGGDEDWDMAEKLIHCLILRQAAAMVYERVGVVILDWKSRSRVNHWREETMSLV